MVSSALQQSIILHRLDQTKLMRQDVEQIDIRLHRPVSAVDFAAHLTLSPVHADKMFVWRQ